MYRMADQNRPVSSTSLRYALRMWTLCVLLPCLSLALIGGVATAAQDVTPQAKAGYVYTSEGTGAERVCFPASEWAPAPDSQRPCYTVARLYEDGSGHLVLGSASQPKADCIVPNVSEERGTFSIQCERRPSR